MSRLAKVLGFLACASAISLPVYGLFHGYFDHGLFEIKQVQWSPSKQVGIVAERSDHDALGGLTYFVLISDHVLSPNDLRRAYYSDAVVFAATATCLKVEWESSTTLAVKCDGSVIDANHIDVQKTRSDEVNVSYVNIAIK
jgi:hypothetical protein